MVPLATSMRTLLALAVTLGTLLAAGSVRSTAAAFQERRNSRISSTARQVKKKLDELKGPAKAPQVRSQNNRSSAGTVVEVAHLAVDRAGLHGGRIVAFAVFEADPST